MTDRLSVALLRQVAATALAAVDDDSCYVASLPAGTPLTDEHMAVLADPDATFTSVPLTRAAVELSQLVDLVQGGDAVFDVQRLGQPYLSDLARHLVGQVEFARAGLTDEQRARFETAQTTLFSDPPVRTPEYESYVVLKADIAVARAELPLREREAAKATDADKDALTADLEDRRARLALQQARLAAADARHHFEDALAVLASAPRADFPASVKDAVTALDSNLMSIDSGEQTHVRAMFRPDALRDGGWVRIRLSRQELAAAPGDDPLVPPLPEGVAALDVDAVDAVELEVQVLRVERPWFWDGLLGNRYWRPMPSGRLWSDGGRPAHGELPAYPVAVVVARNLTVLGRVAAQEPVPVRLGNLVLKRALTAAGIVELTSQTAELGSLRPAATAGQRKALTAASPQLTARFAARRALVLARARVEVLDAEGGPVEGATVRITIGDGEQVLATADDGSCEVVLAASTAATTTVQVARSGFDDLSQQVTLDPAAPTRVTLQRNAVPLIAVRPGAAALSQMLLVDRAQTRAVAPPTAPVAAQLRTRALPDVALAVAAAPSVRAMPAARIAVRDHRAVTELSIKRGFRIPWRPPVVVAPPAPQGHTLILRTQLQGDPPRPPEVPVQVTLVSEAGTATAAGTVPPEGELTLQLPPGRYRVDASCPVYDVAGPAPTVDLASDTAVVVEFRPRTVLAGTDTFLMAMVCRSTPKAPDVAADAVF